MKIENPIKKNQEIELLIDGVTSEGQGVGRYAGVAVFVPQTIAGELVRAHIIKVDHNYCIAKLTEVLTPSAERVKPRCEAFAVCGGCSLQHMTYQEQLRVKQQIVEDAFAHIGGLHVSVKEPLGMDNPWRYRNKGSFPYGVVDGYVGFGFYAPRSHRLIPLFDCPIQDERVTAVARRIAEWANRCHIPVYDEETKRGGLRAAMVRATTDGSLMAVVVTKGALRHGDTLCDMLDVDSLYHNQNDQDTNVLFGQSFKLLKGEASLVDTQDSLKLLVSPQSFLQVNPQQSAVLYGEALRMLAPTASETILDVYCGVGTISLRLAKSAAHVIGIESVPEAISDAIQNALRNGIENAAFVCGLAEDVLPKLIQEGCKPDAAVIDPPRKGCEPQVLEAIANSGVNRLVYVSCNPATLARDAKLLDTLGLHPREAQPVDMFPHTHHIEVVMRFERKD